MAEAKHTAELSDIAVERARELVRRALHAADNGNHAGELAVLRMASGDDLLEALQYVISAHGEQIHDAFDMAHAAIAKATGEQP